MVADGVERARERGGRRGCPDCISASQGGRAVVKGVQISNCARYGLCRDGYDSHMEVGEGVTILGCGRGDCHGC